MKTSKPFALLLLCVCLFAASGCGESPSGPVKPSTVKAPEPTAQPVTGTDST